MSEKFRVRKTCKERVKILKNKILFYRKTILHYLIMLIIVFIEITAILIFYQLDILQINKEMLYWLFSSTAQSMAALFAVVGMFVVFRLESIKTKLRNCYDLLKLKFSSNGWIYYFGLINADCWHDDNILSCAEYRLDEKKDRLSGNIKNDLQASIIEISHLEKARDNVIFTAKIPLLAVLITFVLSIIFISFTESISKNVIGLIILILILALITFSVIGLFYYLIYSISPRKKKKEDKEKKDSTNGSQRP